MTAVLRVLDLVIALTKVYRRKYPTLTDSIQDTVYVGYLEEVLFCFQVSLPEVTYPSPIIRAALGDKENGAVKVGIYSAFLNGP